MSIPILIQTYDEVRRLAIAGAGWHFSRPHVVVIAGRKGRIDRLLHGHFHQLPLPGGHPLQQRGHHRRI